MEKSNRKSLADIYHAAAYPKDKTLAQYDEAGFDYGKSVRRGVAAVSEAIRKRQARRVGSLAFELNRFVHLVEERGALRKAEVARARAAIAKATAKEGK